MKDSQLVQLELSEIFTDMLRGCEGCTVKSSEGKLALTIPFSQHNLSSILEEAIKLEVFRRFANIKENEEFEKLKLDYSKLSEKKESVEYRKDKEVAKLTKQNNRLKEIVANLSLTLRETND